MQFYNTVVQRMCFTKFLSQCDHGRAGWVNRELVDICENTKKSVLVYYPHVPAWDLLALAFVCCRVCLCLNQHKSI